MQTCMRFRMHLELKLPQIYRSENYIAKKLQRKLRYTFYAQHIFSTNFTLREITKQN
jgi:hypothetical protein